MGTQGPEMGTARPKVASRGRKRGTPQCKRGTSGGEEGTVGLEEEMPGDDRGTPGPKGDTGRRRGHVPKGGTGGTARDGAVNVAKPRAARRKRPCPEDGKEEPTAAPKQRRTAPSPSENLLGDFEEEEEKPRAVCKALPARWVPPPKMGQFVCFAPRCAWLELLELCPVMGAKERGAEQCLVPEKEPWLFPPGSAHNQLLSLWPFPTSGIFLPFGSSLWVFQPISSRVSTLSTFPRALLASVTLREQKIWGIIPIRCSKAILPSVVLTEWG